MCCTSSVYSATAASLHRIEFPNIMCVLMNSVWMEIYIRAWVYLYCRSISSYLPFSQWNRILFVQKMNRNVYKYEQKNDSIRNMWAIRVFIFNMIRETRDYLQLSSFIELIDSFCYCYQIYLSQQIHQCAMPIRIFDGYSIMIQMVENWSIEMTSTNWIYPNVAVTLSVVCNFYKKKI